MEKAVLQASGAKLYVMNVRSLRDEACFRRNYERISSKRREQVDSYRFRKDQRLCLGAGMLLGRGLREYGLEEMETAIAYGEHGKPYLPEYPWIHFNLSHSEEMVLAVFAHTEAGCDVEMIQQADMDLARRFFCPGEFEYVAGQQGGQRQTEAFYRLWTLKESFTKAVGHGLLLPLNAFEIQIGAEGEISVKQNIDDKEYCFQEYRFGEYCGAACVRLEP